MAGSGAVAALAAVLVAVAALAGGVIAVRHDELATRKPATPLVFGEDPSADPFSMRFAEWDPRPQVLPVAPVVPQNASEALMPVVPPSPSNKECPPPPCPFNGTCPHRNGYCCSGGNHCCEEGWSCLRSDPPTCVKEESLLAWAACVGRACKPNYRCPHKNVSECCFGGNACCADGFHCFGVDPMSQKCIKTSEKELKLLRQQEQKGKLEREKVDNPPSTGSGASLWS